MHPTLVTEGTSLVLLYPRTDTMSMEGMLTLPNIDGTLGFVTTSLGLTIHANRL